MFGHKRTRNNGNGEKYVVQRFVIHSCELIQDEGKNTEVSWTCIRTWRDHKYI
jgi:hypothetical protein